jgi:hypothetical protein
VARGALGIRLGSKAGVTAAYNRAVAVGRFLNLDRLAAKFNQWIGATAMADRAASSGVGVGPTGSGDAKMGRDPSAVVGVLGEIEGQYRSPDARSEDEDLPALNLEPLKRDEATTRTDE